MNTDVVSDFTELRNGDTLVVMPVSRLLLESPFSIGRFRFYPAGFVDLSSLNLEERVTLEELQAEKNVAMAEGNTLRKLCSSLAMPTSDCFDTSAAVAFITTRDMSQSRETHRNDVECLQSLSEEAERALDQIRFDYCRFDLPGTLPGLAGTWSASDAYCCAILFDVASQKAELIAGEAFHSVVSNGLGLELQSCQCETVDTLPSVEDGEVGGIAQHSLRLFSDVMNANTNTSKYLRAMTLLEFLASPFEYKTFKENKKELVSHVARNLREYNELLERFRQLSDFKLDKTGDQLGYRTLLVHHGKFLEDVIPDRLQRIALFKELQMYAGSVIIDLLQRKHLNWSDITAYRKQRRNELRDEGKKAPQSSIAGAL
jgi:hypothetical protein